MLTLKKIAITGGLSSGKSTVCEIFRNLGAYTVDSDKIVHNLLLHNRYIQNKIIELLGNNVLEKGLLDRKKIASIVFSHPEKLHALESLIHPAVYDEIQNCYDKVKRNGNYSYFIAEVPLLFETGCQNLFDFVIVVMSEEKTCKERFENLKNPTEYQFKDRMMRQIPPREKAKKADFLILNDGTLEDLKKQVSQLSLKLSSI